MSTLLQALADVASQSRRGRLWYCLRDECDGNPHDGAYWCDHPIDSDEHTTDCRHARTEQRPPKGEWLTWLYRAGRGSGKTRSAAEWVTDQVQKGNAKRIALVGRTPADVRDVMVLGESGLIAVGTARGIRPEWHPTKRLLTWPNGAQAWAYSAQVGSQLRGPQHDLGWCDETAAWEDAPKGDSVDTSWNNLVLGLRLGNKPRIVVTTTPKPVLLMRQIQARPSTVITTGSTYANLGNLSESFRDEVLAAYEGTRLGRQEIYGEMLEDIEGALWTLTQIDALRVREVPDSLRQIVVAVDPSGGSGKNNDEAGIIVVGKSAEGHGYVLEDLSGRYSPSAWARTAINAYEHWRADRICAEINFGADMVENTLRGEHFAGRFEKVHASRGKQQRAEPIAALYGDPTVPGTWETRGRIHHVGTFAKLEDEMTVWTPDSKTSPNRMDALVWGLTSLGIRVGIGEGFRQYMERGTTAHSPEERRRARCKHFWKDGECLYCRIPIDEVA